MLPAFPLEIFYDGSCIVCSTEMQNYRKKNPENRLRFTDISAPDFRPDDYGKSREDFMAKLHVRDADGCFSCGVDAFQLIWQAYPTGSVYRLFGALVGLPGINLLTRGGYSLFASSRHLLPKNTTDCDSGTCNHNHRHE